MLRKAKKQFVFKHLLLNPYFPSITKASNNSSKHNYQLDTSTSSLIFIHPKILQNLLQKFIFISSFSHPTGEKTRHTQNKTEKKILHPTNSISVN